MAEQHLLERAATRHGVFTRDEARSDGLTDRQIDYRVRCGRWLAVGTGVYRLTGAPDTWQARLVAACLAGGPAAVASHRAAGKLWRLRDFHDEHVEIAVPPGRCRSVRGVEVHHCTHLLPEDRHVVDGVPVAGPELTLLHLGAMFGARRIEGLVDDALRRRLTTIDGLRARLGVLGRSGRDGSGVLRAALDARDPGHEDAESKLERAFVDLIADSDLPAPVLQFVIRDRRGRFLARADAAWPTARLAVELDSRRFHEPLERWTGDLTRQNAMVIAGWTPLRFTWWDLHDAPKRVLSGIREVLQLAPTKL